jgi:hypothetical protein
MLVFSTISIHGWQDEPVIPREMGLTHDRHAWLRRSSRERSGGALQGMPSSALQLSVAFVQPSAALQVSHCATQMFIAVSCEDSHVVQSEFRPIPAGPVWHWSMHMPRCASACFEQVSTSVAHLGVAAQGASVFSSAAST